MKRLKVKEKLEKLKLKISKNSLKDILRTKNLSKKREETIAAAQESKGDVTFEINKKAKHLHPDGLTLVVRDIEERSTGDAKSYLLVARGGGPLPAFRAGQYISLRFNIGGSNITRPYSISSSPADAENGFYVITVKKTPGGFAGNAIFDTLKIGDEIVSSAPEGNFYYEKLRDSENVLAIAGGSGITPFVSMARAIRDGVEDFSLTILYGAKDRNNLIYRRQLDEIAENTDKVRVIYVLEKEEIEGYEHGFITAEIIKRYMPGENCGVFICGPDAMKKFIRAQLESLNVPRRLIRAEGSSVAGNVTKRDDYPVRGDMPEYFDITVKQGMSETVIKGRRDESILISIERAGIEAPSHCRSGECGWCRAKIVSGDIYVPAEYDVSRRKMDKETGYAHICCSFPLSPITVELVPMSVITGPDMTVESKGDGEITEA